MRVIVGVPAVLVLVLLPFIAMFCVLRRMVRFIVLFVRRPEVRQAAGTRLAGALTLIACFYFSVWFWNL